jgi:lysophospholipase L1-like esterase
LAIRWSRAPFWIGLSLVWLTTNTLTWHLVPVHIRGWMLATGSLPFVLLALAAVAAARIGAKQVAQSLVPLLVLLVLLEGGLRVYFLHFAGPQQRALLATPWTRGTGDAHIYEPHHYAIYIPKPGHSSPDGLRHDSLGLRDAREFARDPRAIRIVFLGGSTTYTHDLRDNSRIFTAGLERLLDERYRNELGERRIEVINAGMGGATSAENLIRLIFHVSEVRPDLLVVQEGINDVPPRAMGTIRSDYGNFRKVWGPPSLFEGEESIAYSGFVRLAEFTMLGHFVLQRLHLARPWHLSRFSIRSQDYEGAATVARNGPRYFERNLRYVIAIARAMGAEVLLASSPVAERLDWATELGLAGAVAEHNAVNRRVASEQGVPFYDFAAQMPTDPEHMPDGIHVSQLGSDLKRDLYFRYFVESRVVDRLLDRRRDRPAAEDDDAPTLP